MTPVRNPRPALEAAIPSPSDSVQSSRALPLTSMMQLDEAKPHPPAAMVQGTSATAAEAPVESMPREVFQWLVVVVLAVILVTAYNFRCTCERRERGTPIRWGPGTAAVPEPVQGHGGLGRVPASAHPERFQSPYASVHFGSHRPGAPRPTQGTGRVESWVKLPRGPGLDRHRPSSLSQVPQIVRDDAEDVYHPH